MQPFFPCRLLLALSLGVALLAAPTARGQDKPPPSEKVRFETWDHVELHGTYYPSPKGKNAACALLLHNVEGNRQQDGWERLAVALQKAGYAVLSFDFRGHGDSVNVAPEFWQSQTNQRGVAGFNAARPPASINFKNFQNFYWPVLANDIAAAKSYLDRRNDAQDCNSANLVLVGAGEGATLGALWAASEWNRYAATSLFPSPQLDRNPEGRNIAGAVWLSMSPNLRGRSQPYHEWLTKVGKENRVPMAFLYGSEDTSGRGFAAQGMKYARPDNGFKLTGERAVKGTKLAGHDLLNQDTVDWIVDPYLKQAVDERAGNAWASREDQKKWFFWSFPGRPPILAKKEGDKYLASIQFHLLGVR
jgi:pimeloyl-ACP methyl ester carboxylesterase